jgi:phenylpyruvate tautomerase PptA (4-oxalocrotonate tautomerase family)
MPIIDIQVILPQGEHPPKDLAKALADDLGKVLSAAPGSLWLRLQVLPASSYAENSTDLKDASLPVFVTVLHAHPKQGDELQAEAHALAKQVAASIGRPRTQVHIEYAPPGAGRVAFGGTLVQ